jgi:uncharacterized protein with NAD-binding domain and iron-sulfur cluster
MRRRLILEAASALLSGAFFRGSTARTVTEAVCELAAPIEGSKAVTDTVAEQPGTPSTKVVILGGGPAGMAAAFWLTSKSLKGRFDVTVYTPGWRLGGKCASGRSQEPGLGQRIEEHGLHMLMGCYRYAFNTIRNCYDEWRPRAGTNDWSKAFTAVRQVTLEQLGWGGRRDWTPWNFAFEHRPGEPGDPIGATLALEPPPPLEAYLLEFANWLEDHLTRYVPAELLGGVDHHATLQEFRKAVTSPQGLLPDSDLEPRLKKMAGRLREAIVILSGPAESAELARLRALMRPDAPAAGTICPLACKLILAELGLGVAYGWLRDIIEGGRTLDDLNGQDFRQWLKSCEVSDVSLGSAPIRALYDLTFAFRYGDASDLANGSIAAGVSLRFVLEAALGYKDAPLWTMEGGTGDVIFTPLYQVLKARGVAFRFFHRVAAISPTPDKRIGTITLVEQAHLVGDYDPFVVVRNRDCWPSRPKWELLADGARLKAARVNFEAPADGTEAGRKTLRLGQDFDIAVLAVPPDVIKTVARDLAGLDARWDEMLRQSASVATEAFQLWLKPDLDHLGWRLGPTVLTSFAEPFDSWADMSHLLPYEDWSAPASPGSIQYFCGCLKESAGTPDPRSDAVAWLSKWVSWLWPTAAPNGSFDWSLVVSDYYRANSQGSERYVQTPAGSVRFRLPSDSPVFQNLYLAGDWTLTRFSGGCFESAIESGLRAAAAISG